MVRIFKVGGRLDSPVDEISLRRNSRDPIRCAILFLYSLDSFIFNELNCTGKPAVDQQLYPESLNTTINKSSKLSRKSSNFNIDFGRKDARSKRLKYLGAYATVLLEILEFAEIQRPIWGQKWKPFVVWRGVLLSDQQLEEYRKRLTHKHQKHEILLKGLTSATTDMQHALNHLFHMDDKDEPDQDKTFVLMKIHMSSTSKKYFQVNRQIYSFYQAEDKEVILLD